MHDLAYDLTLHLREPGACAGVFRIVERVPGPSLPGWDEGTLRCRVERVVHGPLPAAGRMVSVGYSRKAEPLSRAKSSVNHWNLLDLAAGDLLLLVCTPGADPTDWNARSGNQVAAADDPAVAGLAESFRLRTLEKGSEPQQLALLAALRGANDVARHFALEAICRQGAVSRREACDLLVRALEADALADPDRVRFAGGLASAAVFDPREKDDPVNRAAVAGLAATVGRVADPADRLTCVRYLASCVRQDFSENPDEATRVRAALVRAAGPVPPPPLADTLARMAASNEASDRDRAAALAAAWQTPPPAANP